MKTTNVSVLSIHPDPSTTLTLDLKDILTAFGPSLQKWIWCVRRLDWLGETDESLCALVDAAGPPGVWLNSEELQRHAGKITQTIEGQFLAFPKAIATDRIPDEELALNAFSESRAEVAIEAVDGSFFDIYAKDPATLALLRKLEGSHEENASAFFGE